MSGLKDIKIFVSVFKDKARGTGGFVIPVSAGSELYSEDDIILGMRDDEGINISLKNPQYCELTVQYYIWKNLEFDVGGLMHQRRYFDLSRAYPISKSTMPSGQKPYRIYNQPDEKTLYKLGYTYDNIKRLTDDYRIIAPLRENLYQSVRSYYDKNDRRGFDDLGLILDIIKEKYPSYYDPAKKYFAQTLSYFCNMFIMDREMLDGYSRWLYDILDEYDKRKPLELFCPREQGKLAERLFGVYMTYIIENTDIPCAELQRAHFCSINGATSRNMSFSRGMYALCPPGSIRRGILRKIKK